MEDLSTKKIHLNSTLIGNENFYKISNVDAMRPFFMSIVSDANHWMFISSNGGLTAGRKNSDYSLFPYYTDDKITESSEITGSKSIFHIDRKGEKLIWEPFSYRNQGRYRITRNLYKNTFGNKVIFEEINDDLGLTFSYQWSSSNKFGFVKKSKLSNSNNEEVSVSMLDGIQNILPNGIGSNTQNQTSNLVDAYKRSELEKKSGLGIYALSAIIVDKAEPSEALKANIAWSLGFERPKYLLSSLQLDNFRQNLPLKEEVDVKAEKGAYFVNSEIVLSANSDKEWLIISDVNKDHSDIVKMINFINNGTEVESMLAADIDHGTKRLIALIAGSDGMQLSADHFRDTRHFSNTLFNIMRGGIFDDNYKIEKRDFTFYLQNASKKIYSAFNHELSQLTDHFSLAELKDLVSKNRDSNFKRLCIEYLPLKFSRRHGDPSRPWNRFSINTRSEIDGSKILDYEGNWRDIFQNWEALSLSYPDFVESMIHKFLNASTFDGYNPYRITKGGIDWEIIEPDDPWSYIGYWGDHQIIYLLKFLEIFENHFPGKLESLFDQEIFAYANVPYKIKPYEEILLNPKDTIEFDHQADLDIRQKMAEEGADGALLRDENGAIINVNFVEKILATILAKISNFIPEGGIWMNTQRPEWNDANNALVGNGVSMVTLYYLRRFLRFFKELVAETKLDGVKVSNELVDMYKSVRETLIKHEGYLSGSFSDRERRVILDELGNAASEYRHHVYEQSLWGKKRTISFDGIRQFIDVSLKYLEHSIDANQREDQLYHAYNLMTVAGDDEISISYLNEMLEGQVAVLSSGYLSSSKALELLDNLKHSALFREDQYSYLLYPDKQLLGFLDKNKIPDERIKSSALLTELVNDGNTLVVEKDDDGAFHFNGNFKNAIDLEEALNSLSASKYAALIENERPLVLQIFEEVFNHKAFTGRSGTFYGYEGLGSIYWHMVSKLQLAVQECCLKAIEENESAEVIGKLLEHYYEINEGIGVHKPPELYGAFPTDPYSHTPAGKGAQQPGMTGQVKEDILSRFGELGVFVRNGILIFNPCLLKRDEFVKLSAVFNYIDINSEHKEIQIEKDSLCFTYCQVPVIYKIADTSRIEVIYNEGISKQQDALQLDKHTSKAIFERAGKVSMIRVQIESSILK